jgi:hypothetical protein
MLHASHALCFGLLTTPQNPHNTTVSVMTLSIPSKHLKQAMFLIMSKNRSAQGTDGIVHGIVHGSRALHMAVCGSNPLSGIRWCEGCLPSECAQYLFRASFLLLQLFPFYHLSALMIQKQTQVLHTVVQLQQSFCNVTFE